MQGPISGIYLRCLLMKGTGCQPILITGSEEEQPIMVRAGLVKRSLPTPALAYRLMRLPEDLIRNVKNPKGLVQPVLVEASISHDCHGILELICGQINRLRSAVAKIAGVYSPMYIC